MSRSISAETLWAGACRQAQRAMRDRTESQGDDATYGFASMAELLAKSYLAGHNVALIAEDKADWKGIARLVGTRHLSGDSLPARTVSGEDAIRRVAHLHPGDREVNGLGDELKPVFQGRHGTAHVGWADGGDDDIAQRAVRAALVLLRLLRRPSEDLFGDFVGLAAALSEDRINSIRHAIEVKKARAAHLYRLRFEGQTDVHRNRTLDVLLEDREHRINDPDSYQRAICPVCANQGLLLGNSYLDYIIDGDVGDDDEPVTIVTPDKILLAVQRFECPACELKLWPTIEVTAAELPASVILREPTWEDEELYRALDELMSSD